MRLFILGLVTFLWFAHITSMSLEQVGYFILGSVISSACVLLALWPYLHFDS